jgi:hypothetical protein
MDDLADKLMDRIIAGWPYKERHAFYPLECGRCRCLVAPTSKKEHAEHCVASMDYSEFDLFARYIVGGLKKKEKKSEPDADPMGGGKGPTAERPATSDTGG